MTNMIPHTRGCLPMPFIMTAPPAAVCLDLATELLVNLFEGFFSSMGKIPSERHIIFLTDLAQIVIICG